PRRAAAAKAAAASPAIARTRAAAAPASAPAGPARRPAAVATARSAAISPRILVHPADRVGEKGDGGYDDAGKHAGGDRAEQKPDQHGDGSAGRSRSNQPAQQTAGYRTDAEDGNQRERVERVEEGHPGVVGAVRGLRPRRRQRLAVDDADHPREAGSDAAGEIAGLETRH